MGFPSRRKRNASAVPSTDVPTVSLAQTVPILGRRMVAWSLEVAIFAASIAGPVYWGGRINAQAEDPQANLTIALQVGQHTVAKALGLSPRSLPEKVTPLTNVIWSAVLGLPALLMVAHLYSIARTGRSWPKRWLRVQVLALNGDMPGWRRSLMREVVGKWGGPLAIAYGFWRVSGGFPIVAILGGVSLLALLAENLTGLGNRPRRPWHDWLAGTCVVDQDTGAIIRLSSLWEEDADATSGSNRRDALAWTDHSGGFTSVVLNPIGIGWNAEPLPPSRLGLTLGLLVVLGGLAGVGSYHLLSPGATAPRAANDLYTDLVSTLTNPELDASARRAAVLALGNLPDDRVTPLLVDLIAQTDDPLWLDALQQALVARGSEAFPHLRRLNRSVMADLTMQAAPAPRQTSQLRLQTVNRSLAKLLLLEAGDRPAQLDLSRLHLGHLVSDRSEFRLVLHHQDLAGINWQGTILTRADLRGSQFYHRGDDAHVDTFDDRTTDFSGANLTDANLNGTDLTLSRLVGSGLLRAKLNQATLTSADLSRANLEQASLIQANLEHATLVEARLANADLTAATLSKANLAAARLAHITAAGADLSATLLRGIAAQAADFTDANLSQATLVNADLTEARLPGADLSRADLSYASLRDSDLRDVILRGATLTGTDFAGAMLAEPSTTSTSGFVTAIPHLSTGNRFAGVDFSQALNLDADQLALICTQGGLHPTCESGPPTE